MRVVLAKLERRPDLVETVSPPDLDLGGLHMRRGRASDLGRGRAGSDPW